MTENMQADSVQSRQAGFVRCCLKHLLPKAEEKSTGIKAGHIHIPEDTMYAIISDYTMEAGVRGLKRQLDTLCRTAAVKLIQGDTEELTVQKEQLREYLDRKPIRHEVTPENSIPGVVTGLAWTQAGGCFPTVSPFRFTAERSTIIVWNEMQEVKK